MNRKVVLISMFTFAAAISLTACDCCNKTAAVVPAAGETVVPKVELTGHKSQKFEANEFVSNFSVELRDANKSNLYKRLHERRDRIVALVKSLDIDESNIEQNSVSLTKEWAYDKGSRSLVGYVGTQNFLVRMDSRQDAAMLSQLLSSEDDVEINPTQVSVKNQDSLQGVIIEAAVKDGLEKASHYAAGAGKTLGNILYIGSEGEGVYAMSGRARGKNFALAMNSVDVMADVGAIADSVEISANVRLQVELK